MGLAALPKGTQYADMLAEQSVINTLQGSITCAVALNIFLQVWQKLAVFAAAFLFISRSSPWRMLHLNAPRLRGPFQTVLPEELVHECRKLLLTNDSSTRRKLALENQRSDVRQFEMNTTPFHSRYGHWVHMGGASSYQLLTDARL